MTEHPRQDIVLFSTADWQSKYWTNKQHIATRLAARGHRVLYIETVGLRLPGLNAIDVGRIRSRLMRGLAPIAQVQDNLWILSPLTIPLGHRHAAIGNFNSWQLRTRIKSWLHTHKIENPLVWTYHPYMLDALDALKTMRLVYHCVDNVGAVPGIDSTAFETAERRLLERADITFTTSHFLQARCTAMVGAKSHYFGNVADIAHFGQARAAGALPAELAAIPRPRIGYAGALSDFKVDFALLDAIAATRPDWNFVFVGQEREGQASRILARLAARPNVHLLGWRPYADLPRYFRGFDVALLPQLINDYTRGMFPMKFFEYIAAGLPVVSTPLESLRDFTSMQHLASDASSFEQAIGTALQQTHVPLPLDDQKLVDNSWDSRLDKMLDIVCGAWRA